MQRNSPHPALAKGPIYLDYNATTPVDPAVVDAALPYLTTHFGNPSSSHAYGEVPGQALAGARRAVADLLGSAPGEIVFTGGGSESDSLAIRERGLAYGPRGSHVITQQTEHPAVIGACQAFGTHPRVPDHLPAGRQPGPGRSCRDRHRGKL